MQDDQSDDGDELEAGYAKWQTDTVGVRASLDMPEDFAPWTPTARLVGCPQTPRHADIIDVAYFAWLKEQDPNEALSKRPRFVVDISQGVERRPWGDEPHTQTQRSLSYTFALDRVMDAEDFGSSAMLAKLRHSYVLV
jgi:hypothetical protein